MEIHPPHGPLRSFKEVLLQLFVITLGILIALSFEGVREWRHERALVNEAKANLVREIRDNQRSLDKSLKERPELDARHTRVLAVIADLERHKPVKSVEYKFSGQWMSGTAWDTAKATGALALMEYGEATRFADVYGLQDQYNQMMREMFSGYTRSLSMFMQDPARASAGELAAYKQTVLANRAAEYMQGNIGEALSKQYAKALSEDSR